MYGILGRISDAIERRRKEKIEKFLDKAQASALLSGNMNAFKALASRKLPEARLPSGKKREVEIVSKGNPTHRHKFDPLPWDRERFGPDVADFSDFHATFKDRYGCSCDAEVIVAVRAFY